MGAIAVTGLTALGFAAWATSLIPLLILLAVFFTAVNLLEALLPSMISKIARAGAKGTAMGVYSTSQFVGAFLGGMIGGLVNQYIGAPAVFLFAALCALAWLVVAATMTAPERLTNQLLPVGPIGADDVPDLERRLLAVPGVRDALVVPEEGLAYLKVDSRELDAAGLQSIAVTPDDSGETAF
jgi:MFS family permease